VLTQRFLKVFLLDRKVVTLDFATPFVIPDEDDDEEEEDDGLDEFRGGSAEGGGGQRRKASAQQGKGRGGSAGGALVPAGGAAAAAAANGGPVHSDWFADGSRPDPAVEEPVESVARAVREHMDDLGLGSPQFPLVTAKELIEELTKVQATFVRGERVAALADVVDRLAKGIADDVALEAGPTAAGGGAPAGADAAALRVRVAELEADVAALRTELTLRPKQQAATAARSSSAAAVAPEGASAFNMGKTCCWL
jgi:hypothetical protein